jgi:formate hydrogenlyase transcriptional activator
VDPDGIWCGNQPNRSITVAGFEPFQGPHRAIYAMHLRTEVRMSASSRAGGAESEQDEAAPQTRRVSLLTATKQILDMIAAGASAGEILGILCATIDAQGPDMMSTVMLMDPDGQRLSPAAAPRVPHEYLQAITPLLIRPDIGACGTAAARKERVIVSDIATDPLWSGPSAMRLRDLALTNGLRACWSQPLISKDNELLGTFAIYGGAPRTPTSADLQLIEDGAHIAVIAIEWERSQAALRKAFLELKTSEQELRGVVDAIPHTIIVVSPDGNFLYANRSVLDYTGLSMEEVLAPDFRARIYHPEDVPKLQAARRKAMPSGLPFETELRARHKDGQYRWFLIRYQPLRDEQGQIIRWYASGTDIEDRKQAEQRLHNENVALREEVDKAAMFEEIVGTSSPLQTVLSRISKVAPSDSSVLITGETGTGKELVARAIHKRSRRSSRAFVSVNCAAIPRDLVQSELFGHEKGAFTGAIQRRLGRFELAEGGTIFLDEIGELTGETQIALLRVLQEREFDRVGGTGSIRTNVRVIAATHRDLETSIAEGMFRSDLFYRLNVFPIEIPSLRERREDIPLLVEYFIDRYARKAGKTFQAVSKKSLDLLQSYPWPGNIRELQNVIERSVIVCETETFSVDESWLSRQPIAPVQSSGFDILKRLPSQEKTTIEAALRESGGRVYGPSGAAAMLGIPRSTLESKIRSLKINKNRFKPAGA